MISPWATRALAASCLCLSVTSCSLNGRVTDRSLALTQPSTCRVGETPLASEDSRYKLQIILGCGRASSIGTFQLVGSHLDREGLCLAIRTDEQPTLNLFTECQGSAPPPGPPESGDVVITGGQPYGAGTLLSGSTSLRVASVRVRYRGRGNRGETSSTVVRVAGSVLRRYGAPRAFGFWSAPVPAGADDVRALAVDEQGTVLEEAPFAVELRRRP